MLKLETSWRSGKPDKQHKIGQTRSPGIFQPLENAVDFYIEGAASPVVFKAGEPQRIVRFLLSISCLESILH
jgi:hypothetical protein